MGCKYSKSYSNTIPNNNATLTDERMMPPNGKVDIFDILIYGRIPEALKAELAAAGWPTSLAQHAAEAVMGLRLRSLINFQILNRIGKGTYSIVYKASEVTDEYVHKKHVALKKVLYKKNDPKSIRFMAREILVLRRLEHENVIKLEGLIPDESETEGVVYLIFEYMEHDLLRLELLHDFKFTVPMIKCCMQQLLKGLEHCHTHGVLHRDIKGSNLLVDNNGILKIADFGLASIYDRNNRYPLTNRVATRWYRSPELLLSASHYGGEIDLWSCGCILGELFAGKPILQGRTEIEQLDKIFKLCGSPPENYWEKLDLPKSTKAFRPQRTHRKCIAETFKDIPPSAIRLMETLLSIDPADRGTATSALHSEVFFRTEPLACEPSSLTRYHPSKEMDVTRVENDGRQAAVGGRVQRNGLEIRGPKASPASKIRACPSTSKSRDEMFNPQVDESYLVDLPKRTRAIREAARKVTQSGPLVSARTTYTVVVPGSYNPIGNHAPVLVCDGNTRTKEPSLHGQCSRGNKVSFSGPLYVPSNNQMLNDQELTRREGHDKTRIGNMHSRGKQVDFIDFYEM